MSVIPDSHWVVLVSFVGGEATWYGPFPDRPRAARALCLLGRHGLACRHECECCGADHTTRREDHYGKLLTYTTKGVQE